MKINYKYVWRGFNFNRDTQLFAEFFKNTPMIKLLKHNAKLRNRKI